MTNEEIARVCHEANRAICTAHGERQPSWEDAEEWQRKSAALGVAAVRTNPSISPAELHAAWMKQKIEDGWTWGPRKSPEEKTHPCLVPYEDLPEHQRVKDHVFRAICMTLFDR